ncbi:MFS transporter [uncultured Sphingomonas sp.]|uniref:spinster family MFS transporter n=1 Tax=uncultured Sphingomonas sp. TaxID=158754 RepID=UPI00261831EE|nr:MFS transporter [uncultured Sphingomonas sp.]
MHAPVKETIAPATTDVAPQPATPRERRWALGLLLAVSTVAFIDRTILNTTGQAIKTDLKLSDLQLGLLGGTAFALLYGVLGIPVARLAERYNRVRIIAIAMAAWSAMTALCGMASGFTGLLLARIGVGIGEAGAGPPSQSLIADYFPPDRRASAFGVLGLATPIGIIVGAIGGAVVAQHFGWRAAFLIVGLPGLLLSAIVWFLLREAPRGLADGHLAGGETPPLSAVVRRLAGSRAFRNLLMAGIVVSFVGSSGMTFTHPFFVRSFPVGYTEAAIAFALMNSVSLAGGYLLGGFVTDRLGRRDVRWYGWMPGICMILTAITYVIGFSQSTWFWTIVLLIPPGLFAGVYFGPTFSILHNLVEPRMRASATAILTLTTGMIGMTLGPLVTGWLSDIYAARAFAGDYALACADGGTAQACITASASGLRAALVTVCAVFAVAGFNFLRAAGSLPRELAHMSNGTGAAGAG